MYTMNVKIEQPVRTMPCITNQLGTMKIKTSIEPRYFSMMLEKFLERVVATVSVYSKNCNEVDIIISTKDIPDVCTIVEYAIKRVYLYWDLNTCINVNIFMGDEFKTSFTHDLSVEHGKIIDIYESLEEKLLQEGIKIDTLKAKDFVLDISSSSSSTVSINAYGYYAPDKMSDIITKKLSEVEKEYRTLDLQKFNIVTCIKGPNVSEFDCYSFFHVNTKYYHPIDLMITNKIFDQYPAAECNTVIEQHNLYLNVNSICPENARKIIREIMVDINTLIPRTLSNDFSEEFKEALDQMNTIAKGKSVYTIIIRNLYNVPCAISNIFMEDSQIDKYVSELGKLYLNTSVVERMDNFINLYTPHISPLKHVLHSFYQHHARVINILNKKNEDFDNDSIIVRAIMYKNMDVNSASNELNCKINELNCKIHGNVDEILMPLKNWLVSNFKFYEGRGKTPDEVFYTCCAHYVKDEIGRAHV